MGACTITIHCEINGKHEQRACDTTQQVLDAMARYSERLKKSGYTVDRLNNNAEPDNRFVHVRNEKMKARIWLEDR